MNKRAQIFLIATIIIVTVLLSLAAVQNYTKAPKEDFAVYDLADEFDFESAQIVDSGIFQGKNINQNIQDLGNIYASENPYSEILVVSYDKTGGKVSFTLYGCEGGDVSIGDGAGTQACIMKKIPTNAKPQIIFNEDNSNLPKSIIINLDDGQSYTFDYKAGEQIYFVINKSTEYNTYIGGNQ